MKTQYMQEFATLGSCLSFSHAAEELFISQSTLSRHIAFIEEELGEALFSRSTHSVKLTSAGKIALEEFNRITSEYDVLLKNLNDYKKGRNGKLRLGTLLGATDRYISLHLCNFKKSYPETTISMHTYDKFEVIHDILGGRMDIGLVCRYGAPESYNEALAFHDIGAERLKAALPEDHPLAGRRILHWDDLDNESILLFSSDAHYNNYIKRLMEKHKVKPKKLVYTEQYETIKFDLIASNSVSLTPEHVPDELTLRNIVFLPFDEDDAFAGISLVYLKENANPTLCLFLDAIRAAADKA
ncbi:MAG: LysR family transcriptional regulator [Clostridiales bacterium]|jgi:DNA-binding transcriptional LysR family regulator|nr:LysR family transcriptional regulator [Clostridiales bacterium]